MGRPKLQSNVAHTDPNLLVRARAARDLTLRSIRKLDTLVQEALSDVEKQLVFKSRHDMCNQYIEQFGRQQQDMLNIIVDSGLKDEFDEVDILIGRYI